MSRQSKVPPKVERPRRRQRARVVSCVTLPVASQRLRGARAPSPKDDPDWRVGVGDRPRSTRGLSAAATSRCCALDAPIIQDPAVIPQEVLPPFAFASREPPWEFPGRGA